MRLSQNATWASARRCGKSDSGSRGASENFGRPVLILDHADEVAFEGLIRQVYCLCEVDHGRTPFRFDFPGVINSEPRLASAAPVLIITLGFAFADEGCHGNLLNMETRTR